MVDPYTPIACVLHERLEFAVLRGLMLELSWEEDGCSHTAWARPLDVYTRDGAEWLKIRLGDARELTLRLDRIRAFRELPAG